MNNRERGLIALCFVLLILFTLGVKKLVYAETLTLKDCVNTALKNHPDIKSYRGSVKVADTKIKQAKSSSLPQVSSYGEYDRYTYQIKALLSGSSSGSMEKKSARQTTPSIGSLPGNYSYDYYTGTIYMTQKLYDFGKIHYGVQEARENYSSAQYDLKTKQLDIALSAKQAFYQAIAARKTMEVKEEAVKQQQEHLDQASAFYKQGVKAKIEVTKAEVDLAKARINFIKAKNTYRTSMATLCNAMGFRKSRVFKLEDGLVVENNLLKLASAYREAEKNSPELKKIDADMRSYHFQKRKAEVTNTPDISGIVSYNWEGNEFPLPHYWYWGFQINFPIFDGNLANNEAKEAVANIEVLKAQKESKINNIYLEVEQNYLDLKAAKDQIKVSEVSLKNARENFNLAKGRYRVGLSDSIEFTDARVSLTEAQSDYITALTDYQIAKAKLEKSLGYIFKK